MNLKRVDGHLIIGRDYWQDNAKINGKTKFTINIDNKDYYVKIRRYDTAIKNLIMDEMASLVGLNVANSDICKIDEFDFSTKIISEDIKDKDNNYIEMYEIVIKYYEECLNKSITNPLEIYKINNLENIWNAIEYRYRNNINKRIIVKKIMKQVCKLFCFDAIMGIKDRHLVNYVIEENDNTASLAKLYDNENPFLVSRRSAYQGINVDYDTNFDLLEEIDKYNKMSDSSFRRMFNNMYKTLNENTFLLVINNIENRLGITIDKEKYLEEFIEYRTLLNNHLNKDRSYDR